MSFLKCVGCFLLICFFSIFVIQSSIADPPLPTPVGRVVWVKGEFKALMPNKEERSLQKLSVIYLHDTLITDDKSNAQIAFTDDTLMTFKPSSKFLIDNYSYQPKNKKGSFGKSTMNLFEGGFRTITGLVAKDNPKNYQVNTPVATIGVRGTDYQVSIKNGELFIGYNAGMPCVKGKKAGSSELCLDEKTKYAKVGTDGSPVALKERPAELGDNLDIVPAKIAGFSVTPTGSGGFCIQ